MDVSPFLSAFQEVNRRTVKLVDALSALTSFSELQAAATSEKEILDKGLQILLENQDIEQCALFLEDDGQLRQVAGIHWNDVIIGGGAASLGVYRTKDTGDHQQQPAVVFETGKGIIGRTAATGVTQYSNCSSEWMLITGNDDRIDRHDIQYPDCSLMGVPLAGNGKLLGVLCAYNSGGQGFSSEHERFLQLFCSYMGQTLATLRQMRLLEEQVRERVSVYENSLRDMEQLKDSFEALSGIDELTGLHNRRFFFPEAKAALSRCIRHRHPFTIILVGFGDFQEINDRFGFVTGDHLLSQTGGLLKELIREGDILARYGGAQFVLALPETDTQGAERLCERILGAVRQCQWEMEIKPKEFSVEVNMGIAFLSDDTAPETMEMLLDHMLYQAERGLLVSREKQGAAYTVAANT